MIFDTAVSEKPRVRFSIAGIALLIAGLLISVSPGAIAAPAAAASGAAQEPDRRPAPHLLIENVGQYAGGARFLLKQGDARIWLADDAVWLASPDPLPAAEVPGPDTLLREARLRRSGATPRPGTAVRITFPDANPAVMLEPFGRLPAHVSYLIGNDPARWQRDVPVWSGVRYRDLYPGIDLVIGDGAAGVIPWRFEVRQEASLPAISLFAEGAHMITAEPGRIRLEMKGRAVDVALPLWVLPGGASPAGSAVTVQEGSGSLALAPGLERQVEEGSGPVAAVVAAAPGDVIYSLTLAGTAWDIGYGIATDHLGNAYVTGETESDDFPALPGPTTPSTNAFVAKVNPAGTGLVYATYLGGAGLDLGSGIALNGDLAYVAGKTNSADFPHAPAAAQGNDIFVAALNADGTDLRYASLVGGAGSDAGFGIAVDGTGAYVVGESSSSIGNESVTHCTGAAGMDLVVAKLNALGAPAYITCLGGEDVDTGLAIAVRNGMAYVTGQTWSYDFPGGSGRWDGDILIATFDAVGTLLRSKGLGGPREDEGRGIAVDSDANICVTGVTKSNEFFLGIPLGKWGGGSTDAVFFKYDSTFSSASYFATYLGGNGEDEANGIAIDTVRGLYVVGTTTSTNFPGTAGKTSADRDGFLARMHLSSAAANKVTYGSYFGGTAEDEGYSVATDTGGNAFVVGASSPTGDPDAADVLVVKVKASNPPVAPVFLPIITSGTNLTLNWNTVSGATAYQVFRSSTPYFMPGDWSSPSPTVTNNTTFTDLGVLAQLNSYFYLAKAVDATPAASASSARVGKFTYSLVAGSR